MNSTARHEQPSRAFRAIRFATLGLGALAASLAAHAQDNYPRGERIYGRIAVQSLESVAGFRFAQGQITVRVLYPAFEGYDDRRRTDTCTMRSPTACDSSSHAMLPGGEQLRIEVSQGNRVRLGNYKLDYSRQSGRFDIVVAE